MRVGGARGPALGGGVLAADALAGDERDALGEARVPSSRAASFGISAGGFWPSPSRVQIAAAAGERDAAVDRRRLAGARGVLDEAHLREALGEGEDAGGGVVGRSRRRRRRSRRARGRRRRRRSPR